MVATNVIIKKPKSLTLTKNYFNKSDRIENQNCSET